MGDQVQKGVAPIYISDLQMKIAGLPEEERQIIRLLLLVDERGRYRELSFLFPKGKELKENAGLYEKYLLAMINNLLVSFGGALLKLYFDLSDKNLAEMAARALSRFQADHVRNDRTGYGVYLNYINRMNVFLGLGKFRIEVCALEAWPDLDEMEQYFIYLPEDGGKEQDILRRSAVEMEDRTFCSLDVGGNSIKGAVVQDGKVKVLKEYQWYPTGYKVAEEMNAPMILMVRFLSACTGLLDKEGTLDRIRETLDSQMPYHQLLKWTEKLEEEGIRTKERFDSVVIGFPDIVVHNKIAGGESFKQLGLKNNPDTDYEIEFFKTSDIDRMVAGYVKKGAPVVVLNDGNAASYITSVEQAFSADNFIDAYGMFANTIGTEMGTGFISRAGTIQHIPLEGFQHVIDLGNEAYASYPAADIRSVCSMNTGIPGTIQKYISQLGLFRMAVTALYEAKDPLYGRLLEEGLINYAPERDSLTTVTAPKDRRGQLTRRLIAQLDERTSAVEAAFRTMGKALGVLIDQDKMIFPEIVTTRLLSGGIIANNRAYELLTEGLHAHNPTYNVMRLDEETMYSPLLRSIRPDQRNFNVAIGSAYIGNRFLMENRENIEDMEESHS